MSDDDAWAQPWQAQGPRLFGIAYRIVGTVSDAEDVVQEAWLACRRAPFATIGEPAAYLTQAVGRRALNRLRDVQRRREQYVGPWLPEPLADPPGPDDEAQTADAVTMAAPVMMDAMSPAERAAFVLCELFGMSAPEAAQVLERPPEAVRQLVSRGRRRAQMAPAPDPPSAHARVAAAFAAALRDGDLEAAVQLVAPDVRFVSDGGGRVIAARRPVVGARAVVEMLAAFARTNPVRAQAPISINGRLGFVIDAQAGDRSVYQFAVRDGRVAEVWVTRDPDKLTGLVPRRPDPPGEGSTGALTSPV